MLVANCLLSCDNNSVIIRRSRAAQQMQTSFKQRQNHPMRIVRSYPLALAGVSLAVALSVSTMTANAASTFLLQFGQHESESDARSQWDELQRNHPDILGDMSLRVAPVTNPSGSEIFRTQASGVTSRNEAQETCNQLTLADVSCLVVETSMYIPESQPAAEMSADQMANDVTVEGLEQEFELATAEAVQPASAPQPVESSGSSFRNTFLPWLNNNNEAPEPEAEAEVEVAEEVETAPAPRPERVEPTPEPQPIERDVAASMSQGLAPGETRVVQSQAPRNLNAAASQQTAPQAPAQPEPQAQPQIAPQTSAAQVEVAEAIQVPLSFDEYTPAPAPANKPVGYAGYPSQQLPKQTMWVQLSHFTTKEAAMGYWRELSAQKPEMMRLMRVRIVTPWQNSGYSRRLASLRMGPFSDQAAVNEICNHAAQRDLRCNMVQEVAGSTTANTTRQASNPAAAYNRRQAVSRGYSRTSGTQPSGMFWVQLGAFGSVDEAQQRWNQMDTVHGDILGRMKPQISYPALSSSPTPVYHLRTGPFVSKPAAMNLCKSLQSRRANCVVVQAR